MTPFFWNPPLGVGWFFAKELTHAQGKEALSEELFQQPKSSFGGPSAAKWRSRLFLFPV